MCLLPECILTGYDAHLLYYDITHISNFKLAFKVLNLVLISVYQSAAYEYCLQKLIFCFCVLI